MYTVIFSYMCYSLLLKEAIFSFGWEDRANIPTAILVLVLNAAYYYPGWIIFKSNPKTEAFRLEPGNERIVTFLLMFIFGQFLENTANAQKFFTVQAKKANNPKENVLVNDGMWKWTRNPNYFGSWLTFLSFCVLANDRNSWFVTLAVLFLSTYPLMAQKEGRLRTKPGSEEYFNRTWMFFPKFGNCWALALLVYANIFMFGFMLYVSGGVEHFAKNVKYMLRTCEYIDWEQIHEVVEPYRVQVAEKFWQLLTMFER